jgi:uncharacterized protein (DUF2252 family)
MATAPKRQQLIIDTLEDAFSDLMAADPAAFRTKFRKMARDPFAFYRGSAGLFYADVSKRRDRWSDEQASRVWIHGDLHAENFGTYMNSHGILVFDVNDFDEAYVGHFSWDLRRFVASLTLMGWQKALPQDSVRALTGVYLQAYVDQVRHYHEGDSDTEYALRLDNTTGALYGVLQTARGASRIRLLDKLSLVEDNERHFRQGGGNRVLPKAERNRVMKAFERYLETIPSAKREEHGDFYRVKDVVGKTGFGIGSAGLPAYSFLIEGYNQALENDIVLTMKQANIPAVSRYTDLPAVREYFAHEGHRTAVSQRALQVHADPFLGWTEIEGVGYVVDELSPYESDLEWSELNEPDEIEPVVEALGRATAKIHCVSDEDSEQSLVEFQTEDVIARVIGEDATAFVEDLVDFGVSYADRVRKDHALFVEAFRNGSIGGVSSAAKS